MTIAIIAAVLGLLFGTAAIVIPRIVNRKNQPEDEADSQAYLRDTGRSAADITRDNQADGAGSGEQVRPTDTLRREECGLG